MCGVVMVGQCLEKSTDQIDKIMPGPSQFGCVCRAWCPVARYIQGTTNAVWGWSPGGQALGAGYGASETTQVTVRRSGVPGVLKVLAGF